MHSHETDRGETLRHNPPLSSGSARERADSEHHLHQRDFACHGERLQVARVSGAVQKIVHGLRVVPPLVAKRRSRASVRGASGAESGRRGHGVLRSRQHCVKVHPDGAGAQKTSGPQSIGKSHGGWYAKIRMVSASDRHAMIFRMSGGQTREAPEGRVLLKSWDNSVANAPLAMDRAYEGEPESQMGLRQRSVQAAERGRAAVPKTQGLPAHPHAVRTTRRDVSGLPELRVWTPSTFCISTMILRSRRRP